MNTDQYTHLIKYTSKCPLVNDYLLSSVNRRIPRFLTADYILFKRYLFDELKSYNSLIANIRKFTEKYKKCYGSAVFMYKYVYFNTHFVRYEAELSRICKRILDKLEYLKTEAKSNSFVLTSQKIIANTVGDFKRLWDNVEPKNAPPSFLDNIAEIENIVQIAHNVTLHLDI